MSQVVTVLQGNLFQMAAQYLNDATQWIRIAQLNAIDDPWFAFALPTDLILPDIDPSAGGGIGQQ